MRKGPIASGFLLVVLCFSLVHLAIAPDAAAQQATAQLVGTVKDSSGALVPGAKIELKNSKTNVSKTAVSDKDGNYSVSYTHLTLPTN